MKLNMFPLIAVIVSLAVPAVAAERHMMQSLVPADKLTDARTHEPVAEIPGDCRAGQGAL